MASKGHFTCKTCQGKALKRSAAWNHSQVGHEVWKVDSKTGELIYRVGEGSAPTLSKKTSEVTTVKKTLEITAEGDEQIRQHATGYEKDDHDVVFILNRDTGKIIDIRHKHPLLFPIYELCQRDPINYKGPFSQFLADMVESYFAASGYELVLAPKRQAEIYLEVARLKSEGKIAIHFGEGGIKLEVPNEQRDEYKAKDPKTRVRTGGGNNQSPRKVRGRQEKPAKSE